MLKMDQTWEEEGIKRGEGEGGKDDGRQDNEEGAPEERAPWNDAVPFPTIFHGGSLKA